jgi:hypothetical protein
MDEKGYVCLTDFGKFRFKNLNNNLYFYIIILRYGQSNLKELISLKFLRNP